MDTLPMKLRKDLAIHVHFNTLSKVKLFQDCDKTLLYDLVLKLKPVLILPGDYVCKKVGIAESDVRLLLIWPRVCHFIKVACGITFFYLLRGDDMSGLVDNFVSTLKYLITSGTCKLLT